MKNSRWRITLGFYAAESPADAALDTYNERRASFERIRDALTVEAANEELRALFRAFRLATWPELDPRPSRGGAQSTVTIDPILLELPGDGIGWHRDGKGAIHYLGPKAPSEPTPIETGSFFQEYPSSFFRSGAAARGGGDLGVGRPGAGVSRAGCSCCGGRRCQGRTWP